VALHAATGEVAWSFQTVHHDLWDFDVPAQPTLTTLRNEGIFTPPSLQGTLMIPGNAGGSNWGGVAVDPVRQVMVANLSHLAWVVSLFPADEWAARRAAEPGVAISRRFRFPGRPARRRSAARW